MRTGGCSGRRQRRSRRQRAILWDALERGLLCPFQYFGLHDNTDLSPVRWSRKGYDTAELEQLYTGDDARVK